MPGACQRGCNIVARDMGVDSRTTGLTDMWRGVRPRLLAPSPARWCDPRRNVRWHPLPHLARVSVRRGGGESMLLAGVVSSTASIRGYVKG